MKNTDFSTQRRPNRAILRVEGPDARHFLQGLVTADVGHLATGAAGYGAMLTPQGKILFDMFFLGTDTGVLVDCAASQADALLKRLMLYKLRANVKLTRADELEVGVASTRPDATLAFEDPRSAAIGWRFFVPKGTLAEGVGYDAARIAAGLADSDADLASGAVFPHEANFDQFGGVSFTKGCYVGQEVVSRMEHRGTARNRILPVTVEGAVPEPGTDIRSGELSVGTLLGRAGQDALALIRLDRLGEAQAPLLTGSARVTVHKPAFATYDVPGAV